MDSETREEIEAHEHLSVVDEYVVECEFCPVAEMLSEDYEDKNVVIFEDEEAAGEFADHHDAQMDHDAVVKHEPRVDIKDSASEEDAAEITQLLFKTMNLGK